MWVPKLPRVKACAPPIAMEPHAPSVYSVRVRGVDWSLSTFHPMERVRRIFWKLEFSMSAHAKAWVAMGN